MENKNKQLTTRESSSKITEITAYSSRGQRLEQVWLKTGGGGEKESFRVDRDQQLPSALCAAEIRSVCKAPIHKEGPGGLESLLY